MDAVPSKCGADERLLVAASKGDLEAATRLIREEGADVAHQEESHGLSPLMLAARGGHVELVRLLLAEGAPWNALDRRGRCAGDHTLEAASQLGNTSPSLPAAPAVGPDVASGGDAPGHRQLNGGDGGPADAAEQQEGVGGGTSGTVPGQGDGFQQGLACGHGCTETQEGLAAGLEATLEALMCAGIQAELVLGAAERRLAGGTVPGAASNAEYLRERVEFGEGRILDADKGAVMMRWERALMEAHAQAICQQGGDILNIGFGMGLVDSAIAARGVRSHTIVEAHPDVLERMRANGWHTGAKPGLVVVAGRWQDVLPQLGTYDGIFFDTYGEHYEDMREFHAHLLTLLKPDGVYSFFNGLCADSPFFHLVCNQMVSLELAALGLKTDFVELPVSRCLDQSVWEGVQRRYWQLDTYYLPLCYWSDEKPAS